MPITEKTLSIVQSYAQHLIDRASIEHTLGGIETYVRTQLPVMCDGMVLSIVNLAAAEDLQTYDIKYPTDWWEALKERWVPEWVRRRWPVRYREFHIDVKAIWVGFKPEPGMAKYGPFRPYVLQTGTGDLD